jgi:hypothetical protein
LAASAADLRFQLHSEAVATSSSKTIRFFVQTGTTKVDPADDTEFLIKLELKNAAGF